MKDVSVMTVTRTAECSTVNIRCVIDGTLVGEVTLVDNLVGVYGAHTIQTRRDAIAATLMAAFDTAVAHSKAGTT